MVHTFLYGFPYSVLWILVSLIHFMRVYERMNASSLVLYGFGNGIVWTFNEYWIHRLVLHQFMYSIYHKIHHAYWSQALFSPQWFIGSSMAMYYGGFWVLFGADITKKTFIFVPLYYVLFEWIHFTSHDARERRSWLLWVKQYHRLHHLDEETNYGITTPLWDWVFGTLHSDVGFSWKEIPVALVPLLWFIRAPLPDKKRNLDRLD